MDSSDTNNLNKTLTLEQASQKLSVSIDVLLQWNELSILKPTIMQDGKLVYSQEQIDKFLEIKQFVQSSQLTPQNQHSTVNYSSVSLDPTESPKILNEKPLLRWVTLSFSGIVLAIILSTLLFPVQNQQTSKVEKNNSDEFLASQTNKPQVSKSSPLFIQPDDKNSTKSDYSKMDSLTQKKLDEKIFANNRFDQSSLSANITNDSNDYTDTVGYSDIGNFFKNTGDSSNLFDESGNLKGDTLGSDVMGTTLGITKIMQGDNPLSPAASPSVLFTFVLLSSISTIFILKKQLAYSVTSDVGRIPANYSDLIMNQKVIEVDQKMDGTVVLYFQDKEYKLCKPELDSESDQFIERLMELTNQDVKEIEYVRSDDENLRLSTPLSKLVTRLGFVGIKRNLFFPRTSKNKVLFRRYLTGQDLMNMDLHTDQISKEFLQ